MTRVSDERALWLARFVLPHEPELRSWLMKRRVAGLEIDDIIQETYARLISAESVAGVRNPRTYAFSAAHSIILTHLRRARVVSFKAMADVDDLGFPSDEASPEAQTVDRDELGRLAEAIAELPGKLRDVFRLRRVEGLSQREVAAKLGLAESTVEKHLAKGLLLIMNAFARGGNLDAGASKHRNNGKRGVHVAGDRPGD